MCRDYEPSLAKGWRLPSLMGQKTNHYDVAFTAPNQRHAHQSVLFMRHATSDVKMTRNEIHMRLDEVSWQSSRVIRVPDGGIKITMVHSNLLTELFHTTGLFADHVLEMQTKLVIDPPFHGGFSVPGPIRLLT
jgi:hypothetical protein